MNKRTIKQTLLMFFRFPLTIIGYWWSELRHGRSPWKGNKEREKTL